MSLKHSFPVKAECQCFHRAGTSGCQTGYGYEDTGGSPRLTRITDPNGYSTTYAYDGAGRIRERTIATAGTSRYTYASGLMASVDPLGVVVTNAVDGNWNRGGLASPTGALTTFQRNQWGQEVSRQNALGAISTTLYDGRGNPAGSIDPLGHTTTIQCDAFNNPTTLIYADSSVVTLIWGYAGSYAGPGSPFDTTGHKRRLQVSVDQLGNRTSYAYDVRGQVVSQQNALGLFTTYGYDALGNRVTEMDALGNVTTRVYDLAGNITGSIDPLGNVSTLTYDPQNRPSTLR